MRPPTPPGADSPGTDSPGSTPPGATSPGATLLSRAALALYPPSWRARYGDEVPSSPRRLRWRPGRRGQRRLARGPGLDVPAEAPARPPGPDAVQPGHGTHGLVHAARPRAGLRPAHPVPGLHCAGASGGPLGLRRLRRQPGPVGAGRRVRRAAAVVADAAPGLARTTPAGRAVPAAAADRARRVPGRPDRDDQAARPRQRGRPVVVPGRRPGRFAAAAIAAAGPAWPCAGCSHGGQPCTWLRSRPAWPPRSWRWPP